MTNIFYTSFLEGQFNITNYHNISPYDTMLCLKDLECSAEGGLFFMAHGKRYEHEANCLFTNFSKVYCLLD